MLSPCSKSESTDVGDRRFLSQVPFHNRPNCLTWSEVMMRNRKSTSANQVLLLSGIYMRRIVASSLKFPSVPGVPSPPICIRSARRAWRWAFGNRDAGFFGLPSCLKRSWQVNTNSSLNMEFNLILVQKLIYSCSLHIQETTFESCSIFFIRVENQVLASFLLCFGALWFIFSFLKKPATLFGKIWNPPKHVLDLQHQMIFYYYPIRSFSHWVKLLNGTN